MLSMIISTSISLLLYVFVKGDIITASHLSCCTEIHDLGASFAPTLFYFSNS